MSTLSGLDPLIEKLKAAPKVWGMVGAALAVALVMAAALWSREPDYRVLFSNLDARDGGAIVSALGQMNVPYRFVDGSGALMVPADRVHETRLSLASQGLPRGGSVGFELLDESKFGISQFAEQVNYQRALEGELARSIEAVHAVQSARVHLALPKQSMFVREREPASASILVDLYPGRTLEQAQVAAIAHLVSSSVPQLAVSNISVVDQFGTLLSNHESEGRGADASQVRQVREVESTTARRIESILTPIMGPGNVRAQVSATLDFSQQEETSEVYRPNETPGEAAIRSRQTHEAVRRDAGVAQGIPGALSNQPPVDPIAPIENPPLDAQAPAVTVTPPTSEQADATVNYEVDRTIRHTKHAIGQISRLSVAVVINQQIDENGNAAALSEQQLDQARSLIREAMGFSAERGDTLSVVSSPFVTPKEPVLEWWENPAIIELAKTVGGWFLALILALWAWIGIIRPFIKRSLVGAAPQAPAIEADRSDENIKAEEAMAGEALAREKTRYEQNVKMARDLAMNDPRAVASVIRTWMENE